MIANESEARAVPASENLPGRPRKATPRQRIRREVAGAHPEGRHRAEGWTLKRQTQKPSWAVFQIFRLPLAALMPTWKPIDRMQEAARLTFEPTLRDYRRLRSRWDQRLGPLGGDPSMAPLKEFRPLRLSREEDWSDWLAWMLRTSTTGKFAEALIGQQTGRLAATLKTPDVQREVSTHEQDRRADIVARWKSDLALHIEVKVGDEQFEKTFDTSQKLRRRDMAHAWHNFILIPDASMQSWNAVAGARVREDTVNTILWSDVARSLRGSLWHHRESPVWLAWAWTFCGAIEQKVIGLRPPDPQTPDAKQIQLIFRWLEMLTLDKGKK